MKNRKRGFSLVELLIVLAVIAALIATITPVALNAIKKSQATKVAQNMKTLAAAIENAAYVNGYNATTGKIYKNASKDPLEISDLGRDIDATKYSIKYSYTGTQFNVAVISGETVDLITAQDVVKGLAQYSDTVVSSFIGSTLTDTLGTVTTPTIVYTFTFDLY